MLELKVVFKMENELKTNGLELQYSLDILNNMQRINYIYKDKKISCLPDIYEEETKKVIKSLKLDWEKEL